MYNMMYTLDKMYIMRKKIRKQIYIEPEQEVRLKQLSQQTGSSEAEVIRQAIAQYTQESEVFQRDLKCWEQERVFIENLISLGKITGSRTWRRDDLYER